MALCLTVKECEFVRIGNVRISFRKDTGRRLKLWIEAPKEIEIVHDGKKQKRGAV